MKLGDIVKCHGFVVKTHNYFIITDYDQKCSMCKDGKEIKIDRDDEYTVEKWRVVDKEFTGVYVGTCMAHRDLSCTYRTPQDMGFGVGNCGFVCRSETPINLAIVYYDENRKHLVPLDMVEGKL